MDSSRWTLVGKRELKPVEGMDPPEKAREAICWADYRGEIWAEEISSPPFKPTVLIEMAMWLSEHGYLYRLKPGPGKTTLVTRHAALRYAEINEAEHQR